MKNFRVRILSIDKQRKKSRILDTLMGWFSSHIMNMAENNKYPHEYLGVERNVKV